MNKCQLQELINVYMQENAQSRIHKLNSFSPHTLIKREDELSFSISGSKIRKFLSLIPYLKNQEFKKVGVIGSCFSNHVLGISQKLIEQNIPFQLYLKKPHVNHSISSNYFLLQQLKPPCTLVDHADWPNISSIAWADCDEVIEEGGFHKQALLGAFSLAYDIIRNEESHKFSNLFIDSGSGFMAGALLCALSFLQTDHTLHILLLADDKNTFLRQLARIKQWTLEIMKTASFTYIPFYLHLPLTAKSFGSTNQTMIQFIQEFAENEGVFLDPLYSAKLFYFAKSYIHKHSLCDSLVIHSGGGTSIFGFSDHFKNR